MPSSETVSINAGPPTVVNIFKGGRFSDHDYAAGPDELSSSLMKNGGEVLTIVACTDLQGR